jgi:hypothetical protein
VNDVKKADIAEGIKRLFPPIQTGRNVSNLKPGESYADRLKGGK